MNNNSEKERAREACNIYADAFRRRANILNGHTKHHTKESAELEIKKLESIMLTVKKKANRFINQVLLTRGQAKFYKELSATQVNNLLNYAKDKESEKSLYYDALALKNYNNAITT